MSDEPERSFAEGFKATVARFDSLPAGRQVDYYRTRAKKAADRIAALEAERNEWKEAATGRHPNPADFRYWEGRYRDEKARADRLEAEVARLREALEGE